MLADLFNLTVDNFAEAKALFGVGVLAAGVGAGTILSGASGYNHSTTRVGKGLAFGKAFIGAVALAVGGVGVYKGSEELDNFRSNAPIVEPYAAPAAPAMQP